MYSGKIAVPPGGGGIRNNGLIKFPILRTKLRSIRRNDDNND
jgi:hypothetical protein